MQLAVPHPEAQQDAVDVVLGGRLRREDSHPLKSRVHNHNEDRGSAAAPTCQRTRTDVVV